MPPRSTSTPVTPRNIPLTAKRILPCQGCLVHDPLPDTLGPMPFKSGPSTINGCISVKDVVNLQLKEDINKNMQGLIDVEEFVKRSDEKAYYEPFCDMLDDTFKQRCEAVGPICRGTVRLVPNSDMESIKGYTGWWGRQNGRKLDVIGEGMAGLYDEETSAVAGVLTWNGVPIVGEFQKWPIAETKNKAKSGLPMSASERQLLDMLSTTDAKRRREVTADGPPTKRQKSEGSPQPLATVQDEDEIITPPSSEAFRLPAEVKLTRATNDRAQLAGYANEIFVSVGNRRFMTGLFVREDKILLWYYDRIGVVKSKEFSILDKADSKLFMLVGVAMSVWDCDHLGFEPLLLPPTNIVNPSIVKHNVLHLSAKHTIDGSAVRMDHDVSFQVLGGTTIHIQYSIVGRGAVVYSIAAKDTRALDLPKGELVARLSWLVRSRIAEDALIREIRSRIGPTWSKHIPELFCSMTLDKDALGLPRTLMNCLDDALEEHVLRILIAQRAEGLAKARSLEEFKAIFLQVIRCHRIVFIKAKILHRDLSINNLLFGRDDDNKALGFLNDWDLGKRCKADQTPDAPSARHQTGTAPFMALDLLLDDPPQHLYRHDLEYFIYILIFCAMHMDLDGTERKCQPLLYGWTEGSWRNIYTAKHELFSNVKTKLDLFLDEVRPAFRPLISEWIWPLCMLVNEVRVAELNRGRNQYTQSSKWATISRSAAASRQVEEDAWNESRDGLMTFENFMTTIGEDPAIPELAADLQ